jgi:hypothetical protein
VLAAGSAVLAPVHTSKCEPGDTEEGKGDRDADLVQGVSDLAFRFRYPVVLGVRGHLLGLSYISAGRAQGSVIYITDRVFCSAFGL